MTPERWQQLDQLLKGALERAHADRAAFLAQECQGDLELRQAAEKLLAAEEKIGSFLQSPAITAVERFEPRPRGQASATANVGAAATGPETVISEQGSLPLERGATLGRYVVLDVIGSGGMGVVYAAYDPELDRKLAIKLMHPDAAAGSRSGTEGRARLLREAQALASLSHPNVIAVHDVGTLGDQVFVAMEHVEGCTLRQWLAAQPRPWREIVKVFCAAGRGISAAHASGIVHRDFKPDNVLVAKNGRVCVLDFGLARRTSVDRAAPLTETVEATPDATTRLGGLDLQMTRTGALMGTPAYMSPEQLAGLPIDARSDQFAFCSAFYEALCGEAPFKGPSISDLLSAIREGRLSEPRKSHRAPAWLRQALVRGLKANPEDRYPSMEALLARLERDPVRLRWRAAVAAGAILLVSATAWSSYRFTRQRSQLCQGAQARLAGVWDEPQRRIIAASFLATKKPYAADAIRGVERILNDYARRWVAMETEACEATRLRGDQSEELMDLRMACLTHRWEELRTLSGLFAKADDKLVGRSISAAQGLSDIEDCGRVEALKAPTKPADLETRAKVEEVRAQLATVKAFVDAGKYAEALPPATAAAAAARQLHYRPIEAEALFDLGFTQTLTGDYQVAEQSLLDALVSAEAGRHDEMAARAWGRLVWLTATEAKYDQAERNSKLASAAIERLGGNDKLLADVLNSSGIALKEQGKYDDALKYFQRSLESAERSSNDRTLWIALNNIGVVLRKQGRTADARPYYEKALSLKEKLLGAAHPEVANTLSNLGNLSLDDGQYEEAVSLFKRALEIKERALGATHPSLAIELHNIGHILNQQQRYAEAIPLLERALVLHEKALGPEHPTLIVHLTGVGEAYLGLGQAKKAIEPLERALAISEAGKREPSAVGEARFALARALTAVRRERKRAVALAQAARESFVAAGPSAEKRLEALNQWLAEKH
jgi:tetratricopeptide (TPR) repeat protein